MLSDELSHKREYRYRRGVRARMAQEKVVFPFIELGWTDAQIDTEMQERFPNTFKSPRTYRNWKYQEDSEERQVKGNRFRMEDVYSSDLSSGCHKSLSELLSYVHDRGTDGESLWFLSKGEESPPPITNNEALWYCRLSELDSGLRPDSLYLMALVYSFRERFQDQRTWFVKTFERDLDFDDLDLYMAFRPWESADRHARYIRSVLDKPELCISVEEFKHAAEMKLRGNDEIDGSSVKMYFRYSEFARGFMPGVIYYPEFEASYLDEDILDIVPPMPAPLELLASLKLADLVSELVPIDFALNDGVLVNQGKSDPNLTILDLERRPELLELMDTFFSGSPPFKYDYSQVITESTREFLLESLTDTDDWGYPEWEKLANCIKTQNFQNLYEFLVWVLGRE